LLFFIHLSLSARAPVDDHVNFLPTTNHVQQNDFIPRAGRQSTLGCMRKDMKNGFSGEDKHFLRQNFC